MQTKKVDLRGKKGGAGEMAEGGNMATVSVKVDIRIFSISFVSPFFKKRHKNSLELWPSASLITTGNDL